MRPDKHNYDDLDYLANLGYEKVKVTELEIEALKQRVRKQVGSSNAKTYGISFLIGLFLAETLFFFNYNHQQIDSIINDEKRVNLLTDLKPGMVAFETQLDTVIVTADNFRKPNTTSKYKNLHDSLMVQNEVMDTLEVLNLNTHQLSSVPLQNANEGKLKFAINSPVTYIHDLKITEYKKFYFKRRLNAHEVGTPASFANREEMNGPSSQLKTEADVYLHEEVARAMNCFRKGEYDACIYSLNTVRTFNANDVNCSFYLGMCYYYKHNYSNALTYFEQCISSSNNVFFQEARYYMALSLNETGKTNEAISIFKRIAGEDDFYSDRAKDFLSKVGTL